MIKNYTVLDELPKFEISDNFDKISYTNVDEFLIDFETIRNFCVSFMYFDPDEFNIEEGIDVDVTLIIPPFKKVLIGFNIGKGLKDDDIDDIINDLYKIKHSSSFIKKNRECLENEICEYFRGCLKKSFTNDFFKCCANWEETSLSEILNKNKRSGKKFKIPKFHFVIDNDMIKEFENSFSLHDKFLVVPKTCDITSYITDLCNKNDDIIGIKLGNISPIDASRLGSIYHVDCIDLLHNDIIENKTYVTHVIINDWITRDRIVDIIINIEECGVVDKNIKKICFWYIRYS